MTPAPAAALLARLHAAGWTVQRATPGVGHVEATTLGETRGDGTRPRVTVLRPCRSFGVRARHPDGRALLAMWVSSTTTPSGKPSWRLDQAWRGRHEGEGAPVSLTARELSAYVDGPPLTLDVAA